MAIHITRIKTAAKFPREYITREDERRLANMISDAIRAQGFVSIIKVE